MRGDQPPSPVVPLVPDVPDVPLVPLVPEDPLVPDVPDVPLLEAKPPLDVLVPPSPVGSPVGPPFPSSPEELPPLADSESEPEPVPPALPVPPPPSGASESSPQASEVNDTRRATARALLLMVRESLSRSPAPVLPGNQRSRVLSCPCRRRRGLRRSGGCR
ncbi:MAG: hypothetical protein EOP08_09950 [Proteobacteria bacterium]|nr:MAG: hypothetical protein EOP08_09950 [Pseudomonadota bacterium]